MVTDTERPPLRRGTGTPVAGVCLGVSRHLGVSLPVVRAVMIGLAIAGGVGILLYCWLWIFVPSRTRRRPPPGCAASPARPWTAKGRPVRSPRPTARRVTGPREPPTRGNASAGSWTR
ncbi:hypothetical protein BCY76_010095 [Nesterenkonia sp. PF2B19]|nr:hypothetical protein BCY76_010095 [Nesterenkonia sp. PF2B19]